jgi:hypothetical protein
LVHLFRVVRASSCATGWRPALADPAQIAVERSAAARAGWRVASALEPVVAALEGVSRALWERFAQIDNTRFRDWLRTMTSLLLRHPPEQVLQIPDPDLEWIARLGRELAARCVTQAT